MPNFWAVKIYLYVGTITNLQIVLNTRKKSLLKSSNPKRYLPKFSTPKKPRTRKCRTPKKSFDHPCHLKSEQDWLVQNFRGFKDDKRELCSRGVHYLRQSGETCYLFLFRPDKNMLKMNKAMKTYTKSSIRIPTTERYQPTYPAPDICGKKWQSQYRALHEDIINNKREPKFLVYTCPWSNNGCCGYGNRVYALVSLFYLAVLTNRAFLIDWRAPRPLTLFLKPNNINWNFPVPRLETRKHYWRTGGEESKVRKGWLMRNTTAFVSWIGNENVLNYFDKPVEIATSILFFAHYGIRKNKYLMRQARKLKLRPILPGSRKFDMIGCALDMLFRPTKRLQNALEITRKALRENAAFVIGIHIRLGDQQFGRNNTRVSNFQQFFSCAKKVERKTFNHYSNTTKKKTRWFLATDNVLVKDYARKYYGKKVIMDNNNPEHLDFHKKNEKHSVEGMLGVLHDHYMLAESDYLILSESSFSNTAVGLGMHTSKTYTLGDKCDLNEDGPELKT